MEFVTLLFVGCLIGMRHALEPDHMAAVGALSVSSANSRKLAVLGIAWGLGHGLTLFILTMAVFSLGLNLNEKTQAALEFSVGLLIIGLGLNVLRHLRASKTHLHVHSHGSGPAHFHAHSHLGDQVPHALSVHGHAHAVRKPFTALLVGLLHGAAGSGALIALMAASLSSRLNPGFYILAFAGGATLGMGFLTWAASFPLQVLQKHRRVYLLTTLLFSGFTIMLGARIAIENWARLSA